VYLLRDLKEKKCKAENATRDFRDVRVNDSIFDKNEGKHASPW